MTRKPGWRLTPTDCVSAPPSPPCPNSGSLQDQFSIRGLVQVKYKNSTDTTQEHTFMVERQTEATVTTSLANGFTRNGNVGIQLNVPVDVSKATGSFGSSVTVDTEDENTVKHAVSWAINSKVKALQGRQLSLFLRLLRRSITLPSRPRSP
ncbi:uncharacterized protein LOC124281282 [Haliotis rubra]|uniref:uncharacterized protein LOC124281282 n=1 Tax=Haliotis rubra TaxID=36100 RepID=UPI001EE54BC2|nr:uncharacterized protein LOC124281282 [Haliotis rubra]